jgi:glycosyltransferase involved in cell wall biosynthesis
MPTEVEPRVAPTARAQGIELLTGGIRFTRVLVVGDDAEAIAHALASIGFASEIVPLSVNAFHARPKCEEEFDLAILLMPPFESLQYPARYLLIETTNADWPKWLEAAGWTVLRAKRPGNASHHLFFCRGATTPRGQVYPRVLHLDTTYANDEASSHADHPIWDAVLDYHWYDRHVPRWWRQVELKLRLDIMLSLRAHALAPQYDVILAGSEKAGILLAYLKLSRPLVTVVHHLGSPYKKRLLRSFGLVRGWARVGYVAQAERQLLTSYYGVAPGYLFSYIGAPSSPLPAMPSEEPEPDGHILSVGFARRDYATLLRALDALPGYHTEIFPGSQFERGLALDDTVRVPPWVQIKTRVPHMELMKRYRGARFVVLPLKESTLYGAGLNAALEAHASGKAVIATRTPGMPDYVVDGVTGLLVKPGDVQELKAAIEQLWKDPQRAREMGVAGRRHVEAYFDAARATRQVRQVLIDVWEEALNARKRAQ